MTYQIRRSAYSRFDPIMQPYGGSFRVFVFVQDGVITVNLGDGGCRHFKEEDAPQELRVVLTMAKAFPITSADGPAAFHPPNEGQAEIGWQFAPGAFILILTEELMNLIAVQG